MINRLDLSHLFKFFLLAALVLTATACDDAGMDEKQALQSAKGYLDKGELMAASIELRNTLQLNSKNAEARYLLGTVSLKVGDLASAEKEFRRASDAGWKQEDIQPQLGRILISNKEFQKLLDEIKAVDTWPLNTQANIAGLRALAEAGLNDNISAKRTLETGQALDKEAVQVLRTTAILQILGILEGDVSVTLETARSLHPDNPEILLIHASNDIQNKNLSQAAETYSKIITLYPEKLLTANSRKARISLARLQIIEKNYEDAESTLAPLLRSNNKDPEANFLAGTLAFAQGNLGPAEDHIRKLLSIVPDNITAQQMLGKIKYALKDYDQAEHHLSIYLKASPTDIATRKLLTNTYIILNQYEQARTTLQPALAAAPDNAEVLTLLSQIEIKSGKTDAGISALKEALRSSPNNEQLHKHLANAYIASNQTALALDEIKIYQQLSNNTGEAQMLAMKAHVQAGHFDKALDIANGMLAMNPDNPDTQALIGSLYANSGNEQQAVKHFDSAIAIQKRHPVAMLGLARIEKNNGNMDKAISLYKSMVDANIAGTTPMMELSEIAAQQNRTSDMLSWLEKTRDAEPTDIRSRMILAQYYLQKAQPQEAEIYTKEAIRLSPENTDLMALHGKVLIAQQRYSEALPLLKSLAAKLPDSTTAQTLLGETYLRQNMLGSARDHLQKSLALQPDNIIAISLLSGTELQDGNFNKSLAYAKLLQKKEPEHHIGYLQEGNTWMAKKNYANAQSAYLKAWKLKQTSSLAKKLFSASNPITTLDRAIEPLITWLSDHPEDYSTRIFLATIYQDAEINDKAISEYEKVLDQSPDNIIALNNLAWLYSLNGNPKAMNMAESAYRFAPENPGILDTYGWILVQQEQVDKGQRLIKQALDMIPGNPDIQYHYAAALIKSGNNLEGRQILEKLIGQDQSFGGREDAEKLLKSL